MKITIDIDCTPDEARRFLGLPDVAPMQARLLALSEERLRGLLQDMDSATLADMWLKTTNVGFEQLLKLWSNYGAPGRPPEDKA